MKTYIVGSGGVGGYFGGILAKAGNDVTFIARGEHYNEIKKNGLRVKSITGNFTIKPAKVIKMISEIKNPDLILFTVKTYDTEKVSRELKSVVTKNTVIITFQNGIGNDTQIKKQLQNVHVYPGLAYINSTRTKPGLIEHIGGLRKLVFGDRGNLQNIKLKEIEMLFKNSGIDATLSDDITRDLWKKYMLIVAYAGMTAVCRSPIGKILDDPLTKSLYEQCLKEAIVVAKSLKVRISPKAFEETMIITHKTAPHSKSSLLVDIENGKRNEIETLNGNLVRLAKEKSVSVPLNELIYGAVKLLNKH